MILAPTWKAFFASRDTNIEGNQNQAAYHTAWLASNTTEAAKLQLLTNDPNTVIFAGCSAGTIMIFHSFKHLGGTILAPSDKFVCLFGSNHMAPIVIVDEFAVIRPCNMNTPTANDILACTTIQELLDLPKPSNPDEGDDGNYCGLTSFLPSPWLVDCIADACSDEPYKLILAAK